MRGGRKKPQLRRCTFCDRVGHNRATCQAFLSSLNQPAQSTQIDYTDDNFSDEYTHVEPDIIPPTPVAPPSPPPQPRGSVNFFIHHVSGDSSNSPHVINLKNKKEDIWDKIQAIAPAESHNDIYNFYKQKAASPTPVRETAIPVIPVSPLTPIIEKTSPAITPPSPDNFAPTTLIPNKIAIKPPNKFSPIRFVYKTKQKINEKINQTASNLERTVKNSFSPKRFVKIAATAMLVLILPTQTNSYYQAVRSTADQITIESTDGFVALQDSTTAMMSADLPAAQDSLINALRKFENATETLQTKHHWLQSLASTIPYLKDEVSSRQNLLLAGQKIAQGNTYVLKGIGESQANVDDSITGRIQIITTHLKAAIPNYNQALEQLNQIKIESLPLDYQASFKDFRSLFSAIVNDMQNMADLGQTINEVFGGHGVRRYLIVFQNPHEIRATGGFVGSFAIMDIKDGQITDFNIPPGGSYDLQGQLSESVEPPAPLLLSNKRWEFQDANWFPDFSTSAEKMLWFYRKSRNVTADGVIAINSTVLERMLSIIGPVTDEKRKLTLTKDNAISTIQTTVETGPEKKDNKPKQIIADLAPTFLNYFQNIKPENLLPMLTNLQEALEQKEVQAYFTDTQTENTIKSFGWSGTILPTNSTQDYLMVVNSNIQGQKTDAKMKQNISHQSVVQSDGSILNSVVITRTHTGNNEEGLYGQSNIDYIRLYVPAGSELISAGGFTWPDESKFKVPDSWTKKDLLLTSVEQEIKYDETSGTKITSEFDKTVFGNWIITEPGQTSQIQFVYRLPFKAFVEPNDQNKAEWVKIFGLDKPTGRYQLIVQRQSGCDSTFDSQIIFPDGWTPNWKDGDNLTLALNGASIPNANLKKDSIWSLVVSK